MFVTINDVTKELSISRKSIQRYRRKGDLVEGIHYIQLSYNCIRYNLELMKIWMQFKNDPDAHLKAIQNYQKSLIKNSKK